MVVVRYIPRPQLLGQEMLLPNRRVARSHGYGLLQRRRFARQRGVVRSVVDEFGRELHRGE